MNLTIQPHEEVGQIVARQPRLAAVLDKLQIDYCCGGQRPLGDACRDRGLNVGDVVEQLTAQVQEPDPAANQTNWLKQSLTALCDHIEATHHAYLREELIWLTALVDKVVAAHGEAHPSLHQVRSAFLELRSELEPHMMKEEQVLFPAIRQMEARGEPLAFPFGSVGNPIHCMEHEHEAAGAALARLRELTDGYQAPEGACNTYRAMLDSLARLEADMHQHVHKENNVLFPRAIELEKGLACGQP